MEQVETYEFVTETKRRILEKRKRKNKVPEELYVRAALKPLAEVATVYGAHATVVFLMVATVDILTPGATQGSGERIPANFRKVSGLDRKQISRAIRSLEHGGYIAVDHQPGKLSRVQLTTKGRKGLVDSGRH